MAVSFTGASSADLSASGASSTITISSFTASAGDIIIVCAGTHDVFDADTVSGVTWGGGNNFTSAVAKKGSPGDPLDWLACSIWYFVVGSGGTNNIVVTFTGSIAEGSATAVLAQGADTGTPIGDTDTSEDNDGDGSHTAPALTTTSGDAVVMISVSDDGADDHTDAQAGQTEIYNSFATYGGVIYGASVSYKVASGSSTTVGVDFLNQLGLSFGNANVIAAAVIKQAAAGGTIVPLLHHMQRMRTR